MKKKIVSWNWQWLRVGWNSIAISLRRTCRRKITVDCCFPRPCLVLSRLLCSSQRTQQNTSTISASVGLTRSASCSCPLSAVCSAALATLRSAVTFKSSRDCIVLIGGLSDGQARVYSHSLVIWEPRVTQVCISAAVWSVRLLSGGCAAPQVSHSVFFGKVYIIPWSSLWKDQEMRIAISLITI